MKRKQISKQKKIAEKNLLEHIMGILVISLLFAIDRVTKYYAPNKIFNYGISFSLFPGLIPIVIALSIIFIFVLISIYSSLRKKFAQSLALDFGFIFLIAGTLGNLFDRIAYGYVVDFITVSNYFPSFNLADVFNITGIILFIIFLIKNSR